MLKKTGRRHFLGTGLLVLLLAGVAAVASAHDFAGLCEDCHLGETGDGEKIFVDDIDELCRRCHPVSKLNSHPSGMAVERELPPEYSLDSEGRMTCTTCHNPCLEANDENPYLLVNFDDPDVFCAGCHPDPAFCDGAGKAIFDLTHARAWTPPPDSASGLDRVSIDCLDCHAEGGTATSVETSLHSSVEGAVSLDTIHASHPVGQDYAAIAASNLELRSIGDLSPLVALREGKVGCASCHSPYSAERRFLVFSDSASGLCRECHLL